MQTRREQAVRLKRLVSKGGARQTSLVRQAGMCWPREPSTCTSAKPDTPPDAPSYRAKLPRQATAPSYRALQVHPLPRASLCTSSCLRHGMAARVGTDHASSGSSRPQAHVLITQASSSLKPAATPYTRLRSCLVPPNRGPHACCKHGARGFGLRAGRAEMRGDL
jgi:hypothetical protein